MINWNKTEGIIRLALREDLRDTGDLTTLSTIPESAVGEVTLRLKEDGVIAGLPIIKQIFRQVDDSVQIHLNAEDGEFLKNGTQLGKIKGSLRSILTAERTFLNFIQRMSGIATLTHQYVNAVKGTKAKILDTRKTTPGHRLLQKYAVRCGGGVNHRFGLFDMILIKDNHIDAAGSISCAIQSCIDYMEKHYMSVPIEVETRNLDEVKEALGFPIQRIMLDNMSYTEMTDAVNFIGTKTETEASGNVNLQTVQWVARTGVDFISVGALTHSFKSLDISLVHSKSI